MRVSVDVLNGMKIHGSFISDVNTVCYWFVGYLEKNVFIALCELGFVMNVSENRNCNITCSS